MYHVELRQFPHNFCRFNLTERELHETILDAWAQDKWIELGERKWNSQQAALTVLEGPRLPVERLSMGRGWRNAVREGQDVTQQLLAAVRAASGAAAGAYPGTSAAGAPEVAEPPSLAGGGDALDAIPAPGAALDMRLAGDSLGLEALAKLGDEPVPLGSVWQLARERYPEHSTSDCLKLAEHAIRSLAEARLAIVLMARDGREPDPCAPGEQLERALHAIDSWSKTGGPASALIRRA